MAAIAGRTKSRNVTIAETGLPGQAEDERSAGPMPNQVGLPGFSATRQKTSSTPSEASALLT